MVYAWLVTWFVSVAGFSDIPGLLIQADYSPEFGLTDSASQLERLWSATYCDDDGFRWLAKG